MNRDLSEYQQSLIDRTYLGVVGRPHFCHAVTRAIRKMKKPPQHFVSQLFDGWQKTLESHPNFLIVELDDSNDKDYQSMMREFLEQVKSRFKGETIVAVALTGISQLLFAGNLLFKNTKSFDPSNLIHFFLTVPDAGPLSTIPEDVLIETIELVGRTLERQEHGERALPTLNSEGWTNSIGDLQSLRLWLKWLPRYALYTQENPIIIGRTGTGKTNLAKAIHALSKRKGAFVAMTPRDFSSSELVQAELFGAVAGAYTGAVDKWGLVKSAEGGTLFFDEFQSIDLDLQGKLITFIENKTYRRVGSAERTEADVRFVFASNRPLFDLVAEGLVREDFAYRLERVMLELPSLNERPFDIAPALAYGLAKLHRQRTMLRPITGFTPEAYNLLFRAGWPGNLRQLENLIAKACERVELNNGHLISADQISDLILEAATDGIGTDLPVVRGLIEMLREWRGREEQSLTSIAPLLVDRVRKLALDEAHGDTLAAARMISENELIMRLERALARDV